MTFIANKVLTCLLDASMEHTKRPVSINAFSEYDLIWVEVIKKHHPHGVLLRFIIAVDVNVVGVLKKRCIDWQLETNNPLVSSSWAWFLYLPQLWREVLAGGFV